jgi:type III secretion protein J
MGDRRRILWARLARPLAVFRGGLGRRAPLAAVALVCLGGCSAPVAGDLDEDEANRVFVALDRAGVDATKSVDPSAEGKWRIEVARDDVPRALGVLRDEELPRHATAGVLDAVGKGSLVQSEASEHAQVVAGIAGDLERTLQSIDGVLNARVHLSLPAAPAAGTRDLAAPRGTASVLIEHRGPTPPLSAEAVQRLVAGGVATLLPTDVSVVMLPRPAPAPTRAGDIAHVGPIAVARQSMRALQGALLVLVALVALLTISTIFLYSRLTRSASAAREAPPPRAQRDVA